MMPKRVAETDPNTQISDFTGSGPFVFKKDEWKPGDKAVYVKFDKYKPRAEPPRAWPAARWSRSTASSGARSPTTRRRSTRCSPARSTTSSRRRTTCCRCCKGDANVKLVDWNPLGNQYTFRFNSLHKPFDNAKVRQALWYAFNQEDFLKAVIGDPEYYKVCKAMFVCGTPLESTKGMEGLLESNFEKAQALLKEAGYDGTPIVLMHSTDLPC